jgi:hypothetical protein
MIRGALRQVVFLALVSIALLSAAALGGGGCPVPGEADATLVATPLRRPPPGP